MIGHRISMTLAALVLSCASVLATAGIAVGQNGVLPNAVLHEVTEQMKLKRRDTVRAATAVLMGSVSPGPSICPASLAAALPKGRCAIAATASDRIDLATGMGPVHGTFAILVPGDDPEVDGPELVIAEGSLRGIIDLSPAVLGGIPLGTMEADWSAHGSRGGPLEGLRASGTLTGIFRLPFGPPGSVAYLQDTGEAVLLEANEFSLGVPTVKLELNFVEDTPPAFQRARGRD